MGRRRRRVRGARHPGRCWCQWFHRGARADRVDADGNDPDVWSVSCFVVRRPARGNGLTGPLLAGALDLARRGGARTVEGYPVDVAERPAASAAELFHGPLAVFLRAGFTEVARPQAGRPVVRVTLPRAAVAPADAVPDGC